MNGWQHNKSISVRKHPDGSEPVAGRDNYAQRIYDVQQNLLFKLNSRCDIEVYC